MDRHRRCARVQSSSSDGLFKVPLTGRERGHVQQFLAVPRDAETCGPLIHDGTGPCSSPFSTPARTARSPRQQSFFPDYIAEGAPVEAGDFRGPRPTVVQVYRKR